jgi:glycosyltransferase involved in cell wall biosynthesis
MKRLAIVTTHPIQYNAPLFRLLSERRNIEVKVFYTWGQSKEEVYDARFGMKRIWDIPLLEGYNSEFITNTSSKPDSNRFLGVINPGLHQKIKRENFDAVLIYRWSVWSHFWLMQRLGRRPLLFFRGDSTLLNRQKGVIAIAKRKLLQFVYRKVDKAFVVGIHNKNYMLHYGLNEEQLLLAPHAVDNDRFAANSYEMEQKAMHERRNLGIDDGAVVFQYTGKFYGLKQLDVLIDAFKKLDSNHCKLLLTGNGEDETYLKQLAMDDSRIIFQVFKNQSQMPWVYRMGDVFVLPSKSETWGLGVNEAMACGIPAIVSNNCGCAPDLIIEGKTGYVFSTADELLQSLGHLQSKEAIQRMKPFVRTHIEKFSLTNVASAIEVAMQS